jgi:hypothetical protein
MVLYRYLGTVAALDPSGRRLTLASDPVYVMDPTTAMQLVHANWIGTAVYIMRGPGTGQVRLAS